MVPEESEQAGAEGSLEPRCAGFVLVVAPLDAQQAFAQAANDLARGRRIGCCHRLRASLLNSDGNFVFELNAVTDEAEIDLPMAVAGGVGVIGAEGRAALSMGHQSC